MHFERAKLIAELHVVSVASSGVVQNGCQPHSTRNLLHLEGLKPSYKFCHYNTNTEPVVYDDSMIHNYVERDYMFLALFE